MHNNLGIALATSGKRDEAIAAFRGGAARRSESAAKAHRNLGDALLSASARTEAHRPFRRATELAPAGARSLRLGSVLLERGRPDEAVVGFRAALKAMPRSAEAHNNLGIALGIAGTARRSDWRISRRRCEIKPDFEDARKNLAMAIAATHGDSTNYRLRGLKPEKNETPRSETDFIGLEQPRSHPGRHIWLPGTKARKRRGLSTRMRRSVASLTPAFISIGPNTVTVCAMPGPPFFFSARPLAEVRRQQEVVGVAGLEKRQNRRHLLRVRDDRNRHAIETDEDAALRELLRNLRLRIVEAAHVADREVTQVRAGRLEHVELLERGVHRHRRRRPRASPV